MVDISKIWDLDDEHKTERRALRDRALAALVKWGEHHIENLGMDTEAAARIPGFIFSVQGAPGSIERALFDEIIKTNDALFAKAKEWNDVEAIKANLARELAAHEAMQEKSGASVN